MHRGPASQLCGRSAHGGSEAAAPVSEQLAPGLGGAADDGEGVRSSAVLGVSEGRTAVVDPFASPARGRRCETRRAHPGRHCLAGPSVVRGSATENSKSPALAKTLAEARVMRAAYSRGRRAWSKHGSPCQDPAVDLDQALGEFDRVETNLTRLETVWRQLKELMPNDPHAITLVPSEQVRYDALRRAFDDLATSLPTVRDVTVADRPMELREIAAVLIDADAAGEVEAMLPVLEQIHAPEAAIAEYRYKMTAVRRGMVRDRVESLVAEVEGTLATIGPQYERDSTTVKDTHAEEWQAMGDAVAEISRLLTGDLPSNSHWSDLYRHLRFGLGVDLWDIVHTDWPQARRDIEAAIYTEMEPLPIQVADLGDLAATRPRGTVTTALDWTAIDPGGFERLVYNLIADAPEYENAKLVMHTNAPDRGRDISAERVVSDSLTGTKRLRVIVQCKHFTTRSVSLADVTATLAAVSLWEPPPIDVVIVATSGTFTADGVQYIDKHNAERKRPEIQMLARTDLERQLASRADLVNTYKLRPSS